METTRLGTARPCCELTRTIAWSPRDPNSYIASLGALLLVPARRVCSSATTATLRKLAFGVASV